MKKIALLIIILLSAFLLTGCGNKGGYNLIEVTGTELLSAIENNDDIIYATINPNTEEGQNFIRDLKRIAKEKHTDIYYVDNTKLAFFTDETLYILNNLDTRKNAYYYSKDKTISFEYTNYQDLDKNLKSIKGKNISKLTSEEDKKKHLEKAKDYYNEGELYFAFNELFDCWTLPEAKEFYNTQKYFKLFKEWEYIAEGQTNITVKKIGFFSISNLLFEYSYKGPKADYVEPGAKQYKDYKYIVKDDKILIANGEEYIEKYKIISLTEDELILEENKVQTAYKGNNKESIYERD